MSILKIKNINGEFIDIPSIIGPKGDKGDAGATGSIGPQGIQGETGVGVQTIEKIDTVGLVDMYRITLSDGNTYTYEITNGANGEKGNNGIDGKNGADGAKWFTAYFNGVEQVTDFPIIGSNIGDYALDSHYASNYVYKCTEINTWTRQKSNLKGLKGEQGPQGVNGTDGVGISSIVKIGTDGLVDTYKIILTNGVSYQYTIKNGAKGLDGLDGNDGAVGPAGANGQDGYTPIKGTDYFTTEDVASLNIPTKTSELQNDSDFVLENSVLTKDNVSLFVPTTDYQPATKKYVDNMIGTIDTALTNILGV